MLLNSHYSNLQQRVKSHFNNIANDYDSYKKRQWYYYYLLKKLYSSLIPNSKTNSIIEIGCGTGDILRHLNPKKGLGIDISANMIKLAKTKHNAVNLTFKTEDAENFKATQKYDYIILPDVVEHVCNLPKVIKNIASNSDNKTTTIITMINQLWMPILAAAEIMKLKMPEGPNNLPSYKELKKLCKRYNLNIIQHGYYALFPIFIPIVSKFLNKLGNLPIIRRFCIIEYILLNKT